MVVSPYCNHTNVFGLTQYDNQCTFFGGTPPLPQGLGWFIVVGLGFVFCLATSVVFWLVNKVTGEHESAEHYSTAGRSIKMGLTACDIVSKWTWAATLLQSSNVAYKFGVSGPFWYAAGATIQVLLFAILAIEVKRKCPTIHTVLEIIRARWGTAAHLVFLCFCLATNIIVTSMLILGGAAVINALSGVNLYAAAILIPVCVTFYTAHGGLKATYLASWAHVAIVYLALLIFVFLVYGTYNEVLGSPGKVWNNLMVISGVWPVADNMGGNYMTMYSRSGIIFGIINIIGNFGTVFVDQAYWQSAIAARPSATWKGYLLGGMAWFAIPFTLATTLGLAGRAMDLPITIEESNQGLTPPAVAVQLMGTGGAFLLVLQLFMAVTASASAEQIAVANLITYDVYKCYFRKHASGQSLVLCSRIMVFVYGVLSGVFAIILQEIGLSLGWVYLFMGIVIGSAVFPIACALTWRRVSAIAAITSACVTMPLAVMTWLVTAATLNGGVVNLDTTGQDYPMLAGNLVALFFSAIVCTILTLIFPQDFDWNEFKNIPTTGKDHAAEKDQWEGEDSPEVLDAVLGKVYLFGGVLSIVLIIVWPLLALPAKVFSESYFTFWVVLSIIWGVLASCACILLPLWEARDVFWKVFTCQWSPPQADSVSEHGGNGDPSSKAQSEYLDAPKDIAMPPTAAPVQQ